jgi:hypothetical protein
LETIKRLKGDHSPRLKLCMIPVFLLALGLSSCNGMYIKFSTPDVPPAPCPIQDLLLAVSDFPGDDWEETGSRSERGAPVRMGIERIGTAFSTTNNSALQDVYRIGYEREASRAYKDSVESWFTPAERETEWVIPQKMEKLSVNTDQYRVGCNDLKLGGFEHCQYIAQYGPYVIRFYAGIHVLSYEDFTLLVSEIDQRATICLRQR